MAPGGPMDLEVGQVWAWHSDLVGTQHCVLLSYVKWDRYNSQHIWNILDLDSKDAGRVTVGHFFEGKRACSRWERVA